MTAEPNYLRVALPPGIGDVHWACTKLRALSVRTGRPIKAYVGQDFAHASTGYLDLVPFVAASEFSDQAPRHLDAEMLGNHRGTRWSYLEGCKDYRGFDYWLVPNGHLERGERIDTWLPELATDYSYALNIPQEARDKVAAWGARRVLLYMSGEGPNRGFHNNWWNGPDWVTTVQLLNHHGIEPLLVGANHDDQAYRDRVVMGLTRRGLKYEDRVGQTSIAEYCALIESAAVWIGLNSGGGIVSAMRHTPTVMLWSNSDYPLDNVDPANQLHPLMQRNWLHPWQLDWYRTFSYGANDCTPDYVVQAALEVAR